MRPAWIIRVSGLLVLLQQPVLPSNNRRADFPRPPRLLLILTGVDTCGICMERQKREQRANDAPASCQWHLSVYWQSRQAKQANNMSSQMRHTARLPSGGDWNSKTYNSKYSTVQVSRVPCKMSGIPLCTHV